MANDVTKSPYIIDTAGTITTTKLRIGHIRWVAPATDEDECIIQDINEREVWKSVVDLGGSGSITGFLVDDSPIDMWIDGLIISVIESGTLYIYLEGQLG